MDYTRLGKCRVKQKKLYREFIKNRTDESENKYKQYRNTLRRVAHRAKHEYYNNKCVEVKSNMKNLWLIINHAISKHNDKNPIIDSLKVNNVLMYGPKAIANELARYIW